MACSLPTNQTLKSFLPLVLSAVGTTIATVSLITTIVQAQIGNLQEQIGNLQAQIGNLQEQITGIDQRTQSQLTSLQTLITQIGSGTSLAGQ